VYCKFWELDSDHDFSLDKNDLARYNNCALTYQIVERIFAEVGEQEGLPSKPLLPGDPLMLSAECWLCAGGVLEQRL
jgi:hypothetical protein